MNERIKELKHQAFLWCDENIPDQYSHETGYGDAWEDKFAELIVKECIDKISEEHKAALDDVMEDWDRGFLGGLSCAMETVQKHFGVEE